LKSIISFWLEPAALILYLGAFLLFTLKFDRSFHFRVLCGYYFIASIIMLKVFRSPNIFVYNIMYVFSIIDYVNNFDGFCLVAMCFYLLPGRIYCRWGTNF